MTQNEIADRMIGITYNDLEKCKNVVCIAYGEAKAKPIAGALRGGFINTLIIDSACGEKLETEKRNQIMRRTQIWRIFFTE